jgi:hypothetical protein
LSDLMQICAGIKFENNGDQDAEYKSKWRGQWKSDIGSEICRRHFNK